MYYVYLLISPIDNKVFYIGKGKGNRMERHVKLAKKNKISNGNNHLFRKIKSILEYHNDVIYKVVYNTDDEVLAYEKEIEMIKEYGIENLCNISIGYNIITEEIKNKISISVKKLYNNLEYRENLKRIYQSDEYRMSQSVALKNSQKHKDKMSSLEVRNLISEGMKEYYNNTYGEFRNNEVKCCVCSEKIIVYEREHLLSSKYYCSDGCRYSIRKSREYRESMSESVKNSEKHKSIYTEEFCKNISESSKKWWSSLSEEELNEYKENMSESLKNSKKHKEKMQSYEYRENLSEGIKKSELFKEYNKRRKGKPRGKYKESDKNDKRRKQSILVDEFGNIVKEFYSLNEICEYFNIKISTASVWIKNEKVINNLTLKSKK